ncbi:Uncharacterized protein DBV15_12119 [Temnothorax longispinosus]|uniref:Uncharacterized protein n=1 Tax=Temnothorax longispinosus TaxID=300112 RepID=A0A4S2KVA4_9HYME|nr:Uncharacterized protein DBV15_12119 [Temnothorax longispinosus]
MENQNGGKNPIITDFCGNITENYKKFKQRVNIYMTANGLHQKSSEVKVAIFLNTIGEKGIDIFNNFRLNEDDQKNSDLVVRKFDKIQEPNEPVDNFVKELKKLAQNCEFVDEQDMIRDRLVLGTNLTVLKKLAKEMLKERVKTVQEEKVVEKIDRKPIIKSKWKKQNSQTRQEEKEETRAETEFQCRRCNRKYGSREYSAFGKKCNKCRKLNHFEIACKVKEVQELEEDNEQEDCLAIESVNIVKEKVRRNKRLLLLGLNSCIDLGLIKKVETIKAIENKQEFI